MDEFPDIQSLTQQIAQLHVTGELILDPEPVGKHIRRATLAQVINARRGEADLLLLGNRECKYVSGMTGSVARIPPTDRSDR